MPVFIKTPLGSFVPIAALQPLVVGATVQWGGGITEQFGSAKLAQRYLAMMLARFVGVVTTAYGYVEDLSGAMVLDVVPNIFNPVTAVSTPITIMGVGFNALTMGLVHIEDWPGSGQDDNGLTMTPTFVNNGTLTALFIATGDKDPFNQISAGVSTPGPVFVYYKDSAYTATNNLFGMVNAANVVTLNP